MRLTGDPALPFDSLLPIYNWLYPLGGRKSSRYGVDNAIECFSEIAPPGGWALYFHIPFCETICSFCPFVRGQFRDPALLDAYVEALLLELEAKSRFSCVSSAPVRAIYFGGGTPSLLSPEHIHRLGASIRRCFDLSALSEFSFEFEAKSVTRERVEALAGIGVTHARFGLQTLVPAYRRRFALTATIDQIQGAVATLSAAFPRLTCDVLYGMNGQTADDLSSDIEGVCALGLNNIDYYPINNLVTQPKLHRAFSAEGLPPVSGLNKHYMNLMIRAAMRGHGFLPHNGHGYVRVPEICAMADPPVTDGYSFVYHEHVYGYAEHQLLGFGANAVSSVAGFTICNVADRAEYCASLKASRVPAVVRHHDAATDAVRPVSLRLPYHGEIEKDRVDWTAVPAGTLERLDELAEAGLLQERRNLWAVTHAGWEWYSCLMYYLMPPREQQAVDTIVQRGRRDPLRQIEPTGLEHRRWPAMVGLEGIPA